MGNGHSAIDKLIALTALRQYQNGGQVLQIPQKKELDIVWPDVPESVFETPEDVEESKYNPINELYWDTLLKDFLNQSRSRQFKDSGAPSPPRGYLDSGHSPEEHPMFRPPRVLEPGPSPEDTDDIMKEIIKKFKDVQLGRGFAKSGGLVKDYQKGGKVADKAESKGLKKWLEKNVGKKQILPVLEFMTGVPAAGERGRDVSAADLLLTAPALGMAGKGIFNIGKDLYKRATTVPVWRGVTTPTQSVVQKAAGGAEEVITGSPLYSKMLHTTLKPKVALNYTREDVLRGGAPAAESQLLKFRVPKKEFYEQGKLGAHSNVQEVLFPSLPKSTLQYAKHPSDLSILDKLEIAMYNRGEPRYLDMMQRGLKVHPGVRGAGAPKFYTEASDVRFDPEKFQKTITDLYAQ